MPIMAGTRETERNVDVRPNVTHQKLPSGMKVNAILHTFYENVSSLEEWIRAADSEGLLESSLVVEGDPEGYRHLLGTTLVAVRAGSRKLTAPFSLSQAAHQHELVTRCVQRVLHRDGTGNNVLTFGFGPRSDNPKASVSSVILDIEYRYPNTSVSRLQFKVWKTLLTRIGDTLMSHLLENTSMFILLIKPAVYLQITGEPVYQLWPYSAGSPWTKNENPIRSWKRRATDPRRCHKRQKMASNEDQPSEGLTQSWKRRATDPRRCHKRQKMANNEDQPSEGLTQLSGGDGSLTIVPETSVSSMENLSANSVQNVEIECAETYPLPEVASRTKTLPGGEMTLTVVSETSVSSMENLSADSVRNIETECAETHPLPEVSARTNKLPGGEMTLTVAPETSVSSMKNADSVRSMKTECAPKFPLPNSAASRTKRQKKRDKQNRKKQKLKPCTTGTTAFQHHLYVPRRMILYGKHLREKFPETFGPAKFINSEEGSALLFDDVFVDGSVGGNLSRIHQQCQCQQQTEPPCESWSAGQNASSTDMIRGRLLPLLQTCLSNHRKMKYWSFLNRHCPCKTVRKKVAGAGVGKELSHSKRRKLHKLTATAKLLEDHVSHQKVFAFLKAVVKCTIPVQLVGSPANMTVFLKNIRTLVSCGKFERMCLGQLMKGMKVMRCGWLVGVWCLKEREHRMAQLVWWLVVSFILPVVKTFFYVTDTTTYRNRVFFFRKRTWMRLQTRAVQEFRKATCLKPISKCQVDQWLASGQTLGVSVLRFLPKTRSLRPIVNMSGKPSAGSLQKKSINKQLNRLFQVLTYEKGLDEKMCGCTVFGMGDIYTELKDFKKSRASHHDDRTLYFVKSDISNCFDSVLQQKLFQFVKAILTKDNQEKYMMRKFASVRVAGGRVKRLFHTDTTRLSHYQPDFVGFLRHKFTTGGWSDIIVVDMAFFQEDSTASLLQLLSSHLFNNVIKIGLRHYLQTTGISQGSVMSTLLASVYLAHLESTHLTVRQDELLIRRMDDYLFITPDRARAQQFVHSMREGFPDFNCFISVDKILTNFPSAGDVKQVEQEGPFPWCGLLINTTSLEVAVDYSRYSGMSITDTATFDTSFRAGQTLSQKLLMCLKIKCHAIFLDPQLNSRERVLLSLYQALLFVAVLFHSFVLKLPASKRVDTNPRFFSGAVGMIPNYIQNLVSKRLKLAKCAEQSPVPLHLLQWLTADAFLVRLHPYPGYRHLKTFLRAMKLSSGKKLLGRQGHQYYVPGGWTEWPAWSNCGCGTQHQRRRLCTNPSPQNGGAHCPGQDTQLEDCSTSLCSDQQGSWGSWPEWPLCSADCGGGQRSRERTCEGAGGTGQAVCAGSATEVEACNTHTCPVHGDWNIWSGWSLCSATCGSGSQTRQRICDNPVPAYEGDDCSGSDTDQRPCQEESCPECGPLGRGTGELPWKCTETLSPYYYKRCTVSCRAGFVLLNEDEAWEGCGHNTSYSWNFESRSKNSIQGKPVFCAKAVTSTNSYSAKASTSTDCDPANQDAAKNGVTQNIENNVACTQNGLCRVNVETKCKVSRKRSTPLLQISVTANPDIGISDSDLAANATAWAQYLQLMSMLNQSIPDLTTLQSLFTVTLPGGQTMTPDTGSIDYEVEVVCPDGSILRDFFCMECPVGSMEQDEVCVQCPLGFYQDQPASTTCKPCPPGKTWELSGAVSLLQCVYPLEMATTGTQQPPLTTPDNDDNEMDTGVLLGVLFGVLALLVIILITVCFIYKHISQQQRTSQRGSWLSLNRVLTSDPVRTVSPVTDPLPYYEENAPPSYQQSIEKGRDSLYHATAATSFTATASFVKDDEEIPKD